MRQNDESTSLQLKAKLEDDIAVFLSTSTIRKARIKQGWTLQGTAYCQLVRDANKVKRLEFAEQVLATGDTLDNVIFTDECSVSAEQYRRTCYRKIDEPQKRKPKPKHPLKVHVWAGISKHGPTKICIFDGIMDAELYCEILESSLIPFINEKLPNHRFMQDNDPKHRSRRAQAFFLENNVNWWRTPPESPDMNPIENLWHKLKEFVRIHVKPRTKPQLINVIKTFWEDRVDRAKCLKYIGHVLNKAVPAVVESRGCATRY